MDQKKQLLLNTIIIAIGKLGTQIISFILLPLYTNALTPAEYGTYDFWITLSTFLLPIITLMMEESMFRFLIDANTQRDKKRIITATVFYTTWGTILFSVIALIVMAIMHYEYAVAFLLFIISNILIGLSNAIARGNGKVKLYSLSNFILGVSTIILNILFIVVFKLGAVGLLWANTVANSLTAIAIFAMLNLKKYVSRKYLNKNTLSEMIRYSIPLVPNNLSWIIISLSDRLMLNLMNGTEANGLYSIANKFPNIVYTCYGFFSTAWKESAARILQQDNKEKYYNGIYRDVRNFLHAVVLGLIAIMPFAFSIFINESYNDAYMYIPILTIAIYYTNMSNFYGGIFTAYKDTKIMGSTTIVAAVLNIVINLIFIPMFGIYAASFSTLISNIVVYAYRRYKLKNYINLKSRINILYYALLTITTIAYYYKNTIVCVLIFIIDLAFCIYTNQAFIKGIIRPIIRKIKK